MKLSRKTISLVRRALARLQIVLLPDAVEDLDHPVDRLTFERGQIGPPRQELRGLPEFEPPTAIEVEQVLRGRWLVFFSSLLLAISSGCSHIESLS